MTKCYIRKDLLVYDIPPTDKGYLREIDWRIPHQCWQPEDFEANGFNLIVFLPEMNDIVLANSIDFDFLNEKEA